MSNGRGKLMSKGTDEDAAKNKLRNKKGPGIGGVAGSIPMTGGALGMAGSRVKELLDELASETEASKKNVMGIDKITGSFPGAGRAATKRLTVDEMKKMSPGEKKARFGKAFKVGGVVDLSTEQEV
tara:strand:- start:467 stop:844 length:378 start_codon:yes stop_codon:yes gene_type:complete